MAFDPLLAAGLALWLSHHPRKGRFLEGQAARGSWSLPGYIDIVMEMRLWARPGTLGRMDANAESAGIASSSDLGVPTWLTVAGRRLPGTRHFLRKATRLEAGQKALFLTFPVIPTGCSRSSSRVLLLHKQAMRPTT